MIMATTQESIFSDLELAKFPIFDLSLVKITKGTTAKLN